MITEVHDTRYVVRTVAGKPLFIVAEQKAINGAGGTISHYRLSDDLLEAAKCINLTTAKTLIKDFTSAKESTKTFEPVKIRVTYTLEEDDARR